MVRWLTGHSELDVPADPGRVHAEGRTARAALEVAREQVAALLGMPPRSVVLTSGGTESVNAACFGATRARPGAPVLLARVEHSSVREASERFAETIDVAVDGSGRIDPEHVDATLARLAAAGRSVALVHCQAANHEVGTIQPVGAVAEACHRHGALLHVDACASAGHLPSDAATLGADLVSVSSHKLGGPPGVGALVVRRGQRIDPLIVGGSQERGRRAGLENLPAALGFGAAAAALAQPGAVEREAEQARAQVASLTSAAIAVEGVEVLGDPDPAARLPHMVCFAVEGVEGEPLLLALDQAGIAAHSGSSCSSEALEPSPVLTAMGKDPERSLRVSVGWSTTDADVEAFCQSFGPALERLRMLRT